MRGDWMNAVGKERPHVPASGDVPFLPAVWDSPLWLDDSLRSYSLGITCAQSCVLECVVLRECAQKCAVYG